MHRAGGTPVFLAGLWGQVVRWVLSGPAQAPTWLVGRPFLPLAETEEPLHLPCPTGVRGYSHAETQLPPCTQDKRLSWRWGGQSQGRWAPAPGEHQHPLAEPRPGCCRAHSQPGHSGCEASTTAGHPPAPMVVIGQSGLSFLPLDPHPPQAPSTSEAAGATHTDFALQRPPCVSSEPSPQSSAPLAPASLLAPGATPAWPEQGPGGRMPLSRTWM